MHNKKTETLYIFSIISGIIILFFIIFPIANTLSWTKPDILLQAILDNEVMDAMYLSIICAALATLVSFFLGVPFAYLLARRNFKFKSLIESIVNVPIVIPHTVAGICLLTILTPRSFLGRFIQKLGLEIIGSKIGIVLAMTFVSMPLLINSAKEAFKWVSPRIENVSRSLGATHTQTFFLITFRLAWRDILSGMILTWARAISEFGAVIIIAYHPMIAPTLIYERFTTYGMSYAIPVTTILIILCLIIFIALRLISHGRCE